MANNYCCEEMGDLDKKEIIDYIPNHLTTLDVGGYAYPIHYCPFCGDNIKGTAKAMKQLKQRIKRVGKTNNGN